ncbi:uncharacterized protein LOC111330305 [Stylophora pistillata]|uniref:Uncharacterized protein n=1 Tax=Stylophora pistillata TaxID=50429 RepID=A0A2B4S9K7_STYPI|nr:uncharacterized protein LOC111330305 [Stylophora pistillata]PFX25480.1 hypothetical protein AWC38_SpisGene9872 [Stylophora pistillata]
MILLVLAITVAFGRLPQIDAALPNVGKCTFLEYYCALREYESHFFKSLYQVQDVDCGLQFWMLYYRSLQTAVTCESTSKPLEVGNIREFQTLYCNGLDLEIPLMFSLSPCSSSHKQKVDQCIREFSNLFQSGVSKTSLCRIRAKAKVCVALSWQTLCDQSDEVNGIFNQVIGDFNPFCKDDKDPWSTESDSCAPYRIPYRGPVCQNCTRKTLKSSSESRGAKKCGAQITHDVAFLSLTYFVHLAAILLLDYLII